LCISWFVAVSFPEQVEQDTSIGAWSFIGPCSNTAWNLAFGIDDVFAVAPFRFGNPVFRHEGKADLLSLIVRRQRAQSAWIMIETEAVEIIFRDRLWSFENAFAFGFADAN